MCGYCTTTPQNIPKLQQISLYGYLPSVGVQVEERKMFSKGVRQKKSLHQAWMQLTYSLTTATKKQTIVSKLRPETIPVNRHDGAREQDLAAVDCCY